MNGTLIRPLMKAVAPDIKDIQLLPMQQEMLNKMLPPLKKAVAAPEYIPASIFCDTKEQAIAFITILLLEVKEYDILDYTLNDNYGKWQIVIEGKHWEFRWYLPTRESVRGKKAFVAFVHQSVTDSWVLGYISLNHPKGVFRF